MRVSVPPSANRRLVLGAVAALGLAALVPLGAASFQGGQDAAPSARAPDPAANPVAAPFVLGVQTHFGQGWPGSHIDSAASVAAPLLRDGLAWADAEKTAGTIDLPAAPLARFARACANDMRLMLTIVPANPVYDGGLLVTSDAGVAAFARYLDVLAGRLGPCLVGIEVGNEINGSSLRAAGDLPAAYAALLRRIHAPFKERHPGVAVIGGSTNAVGTGFLVRLFERGMLDHADGIAVHPYRDHAENVDWEIDHLNAEMQRHGRVLPIWASEFSDAFDRPSEGASAVVKMATLLSGSGVHMASWYALADQKWFPAMGLFTEGGAEKPAAAAFRFVQRELLPHGRPVPVSEDRLNPVWRYGTDRWVVWGAPRPLQLAEGAQVFDAMGERLDAADARVGMAPLVVIGPRPALGPTDLVADSLLQFGSPPWSYHAGTAAALTGQEPDAPEPGALGPLNSDFQTSLGNRFLRPLRIDDSSGAVTPAAQVMARYTAPADMQVSVQGCFARGGDAASTVAISIDGAGRPVGQAVLARTADIRGDAALKAGDRLDIRFAARAGTRGHTFRYRIRLYRQGTPLAACPAEIAGWS